MTFSYILQTRKLNMKNGKNEVQKFYRIGKSCKSLAGVLSTPSVARRQKEGKGSNYSLSVEKKGAK
jgi:hypothetical protein